MTDPNKESRKRNLEDMQSSPSKSSFEYVEKYELNDVMKSLSNIQNSLASLMINFETQRKDIADMKNDIYGKHGVENRLQEVQSQADDTISQITEFDHKQQKMSKEINMLSDLVVKLEQKIDLQNHQILELKLKTTETNIIITGLNETEQEILPERISEFFKEHLEMSNEEIGEVGIVKVYRQGDPKAKRKFPRPVFVQFQDVYQKEKIMKKIPKLKAKNVPIRISNQYPEEIREKRKRLYDLQNSYKEKNIPTTIKGDKLIFNNSGSVYREKIARPKACDILENFNDKSQTEIYQGKQIEDNGNRFSSHACSVSSVKQVNQGLREILRMPKVSSATHNVYAYIFTNADGVIHEGSDDDGEHGAGRALLQELKDHNVSNCVVVVSRWFSSKIGARRFRHILDVGMSAVHLASQR